MYGDGELAKTTAVALGICTTPLDEGPAHGSPTSGFLREFNNRSHATTCVLALASVAAAHALQADGVAYAARRARIPEARPPAMAGTVSIAHATQPPSRCSHLAHTLGSHGHAPPRRA